MCIFFFSGFPSEKLLFPVLSLDRCFERKLENPKPVNPQDFGKLLICCPNHSPKKYQNRGLGRMTLPSKALGWESGHITKEQADSEQRVGTHWGEALTRAFIHNGNGCDAFILTCGAGGELYRGSDLSTAEVCFAETWLLPSSCTQYSECPSIPVSVQNLGWGSDPGFHHRKF